MEAIFRTGGVELGVSQISIDNQLREAGGSNSKAHLIKFKYTQLF